MLNLIRASVSPRFFLEARDLSDFVCEFGPFSGSYVATRLPLWMSSYREHLDQLSDVDRARAVLVSKKIECALLPHPAIQSLDADVPWTQEALTLQKRDVEVVIGDALEPQPFLAWTDAVDTLRFSRKGGWKFRGSVGDYVQLVEPFLLHAPALYLVDPYFDVLGRSADDYGGWRPNGGQDRLVSHLLERAASIKGGRCYELHVIVDAKKAFGTMTDEQFKEAIHSRFSQSISKGRSLHVHLVTGGYRGGKFLRHHNRYFLSRVGGLALMESIEILEHGPPQTEVQVLAPALLDDVFATYAEGVARFPDRLTARKDIVYPKNVSSFIVT